MIGKLTDRSFLAAIVLFVLLALVIIGLHPLQPSQLGLLTSGAEGDRTRQLAYLLVFGLSLALIGIRGDARVLLLPIPLILLLAWCWASVLWSVAPPVALRRLILTTIIIWTVFVCVRQAGFDRSFDALQAILAVTLLLNFTAVAISPLAVHQASDPLDPTAANNWRGLLNSKNAAGPVCAITVLAALFYGNNVRRWLRWALILGASIFLWKTVSKTSMAFLVVSIALGVAYMRLGSRARSLLLPILGILVALGAAALFSFVDLTDPRTLTGRSQIWSPLIRFIQDHWMFGAGFGSFWNAGDQSPAFRYAQGWVTLISTGHNGYLDLLAQIGAPGLVLALLALILGPLWTLLCDPRIPASRGAFAFSGLAFCIGQNITESTMLNRDEVAGVIMILMVALAAQASREAVAASPAAAPNLAFA